MGENAYLGISSAAKEKKVLIGVTRIVSNKFLDLKQKGFKAALEEAGYVEVRKEFVERVPRTLYKLTSSGHSAIERYRENMRQVIDQLL